MNIKRNIILPCRAVRKTVFPSDEGYTIVDLQAYARDNWIKQMK